MENEFLQKQKESFTEFTDDVSEKYLRELGIVDLDGLKSSNPETEKLPFKGGDNIEELGKALDFFRKNCQPRKVNVGLGKLSVILTYNPELYANNMGWSTGENNAMYDATEYETDTTNYCVEYRLTDAVLEPDQKWLKEAEASAQQKIGEAIQSVVDNLKHKTRRYDETHRYYASWVDGYKEKIEEIKQMSFEDRGKLLDDFVVNTRNDIVQDGDEEQLVKRLLWERNEFAPRRLDEIIKNLPIVNYGQITSDGEITWFGLPVNRSPMYKGVYDENRRKYFPREVVGKSIYEVEYKYDDRLKLSVWLDNHEEYFNTLMRYQKGNGLPEIKIKETNESKEQLEQRLGKSAGLEWVNYLESWMVNVEEDMLFLSVKPRGDQQSLLVCVEEGHGYKFKDVCKVVDFIIEKGFVITNGVKKALIEQASDSKYINKIEQLLVKKDIYSVDPMAKFELPFEKWDEGIELPQNETEDMAYENKNENVSPEKLFKECLKIFEQYNLGKDNDYEKQIEDYHQYYGLSYDDSKIILETIKNAKESLDGHQAIALAPLENIKILLANGAEYGKKLLECWGEVDKKIEESYSRCPLCEKEFQEPTKGRKAIKERLRQFCQKS
ncbi:MAG: hypothetical protein NTV62_00935 [Candidatus Gribaldobacteria bacterium]|nr:hypothetical protein [Candidatus Gribaldobacteria bacterium]